MKRMLCILTLALMPMVSAAQAAKLVMPDFSALAEKATESVDVTLEGETLKSAGQFLGGRAVTDEAALQEALKGIEGIYVKVFSFEQDNVYSMRDVDAVVAQTKSGGWKKLLSIRDKGERVEMWIREHDVGGGFLFIATEPKELVIINIVGDVDLEKLRRLQGHMGMPNFRGIRSTSQSITEAPPAL